MVRWVWISVSCAGFFGCAYGEVRQVVRAQFAAELDCPEVLIQKRDVWYVYDSVDQYKVSGCGVMRTYTCPASEDGLVSYDEPACTWVKGDADAPVAPKPMALEDDPLAEPEPLEEEGAVEPEPAPKKPEAKEPKPEEKPAADKPEPEAEKPEPKPEAKPDAKPAKAKGGIKTGIKLGGSTKKAK